MRNNNSKDNIERIGASMMDRRHLLRLGTATGALYIAAPILSSCSSNECATATTTTENNASGAEAAPTTAASKTTVSAFGELAEADANGVMLASGYTSRIIATSRRPIDGTDYVFPDNPDGGAVFVQPDSGWIYVVNHETPDNGGGVTAIRFDQDGNVTKAYPILENSSRNCAGGATPWGTWLSCEEYSSGAVFECDPTGENDAVRIPAMGLFNHEAAAVDPKNQWLYLTEDEPDGGLYRYLPDAYPDLTNGKLEVLCTGDGDELVFKEISDPSGESTETRKQNADMQPFAGGEGICYFDGEIFFTTKYDNTVWKLDCDTNELSTVYVKDESNNPILEGVDNVTITDSGDLYVCEDGGNMQVVLLRGSELYPVAQIPNVEDSEIVGVAIHPNGDRMYFSSQRNPGVTYEVSGAFT